ncbi:MAG: mechanosensitive ion channel [Helicobacter sp.]|nr:mechanosensitive ion channel [Helicobacter sp.]
MLEKLTDLAVHLALFLTICKALIIVILGYFIALFLKRKTRKILSKKDEILAIFTAQLVFIISLIVVAITALSALGVQVASILAVLGTAGLAIALALKDSLSSIAGGIILIVLRPFTRGDIVEINGIEGRVECVTLFNTTVRLHDNKLAIIPNRNIASSNIINATDAPTRRIDIVVGVGYDSDLALAAKVLKDVVADFPKIDREKEPLIGITDFGESSINFIVRVFANLEDGLFAIKSDLIAQIKLAFDANNIEIPYNKLDLQITEIKKL